MDRPLEKSYLKKQRLRRLTVILAFVVAGILLLLIVPQLFTTALRYSDLTGSVVTRGDLETTVGAAGVVAPAYEEVIGSPVDSKLKLVLRKTGDSVEIGDTLLLLDPSVEAAALQRLVDEKELKVTRLNQFRIETEENEVQFSTNRKIKELEVLGLKADYENEFNIHKIGGSPAETVEKARTAYEIAKLQLEQIVEQNRHKKRMEQSQITELELEIKLSDAAIAEKKAIIATTTVTAANKGVITWLETHVGQTVSRGQQLARISDLSRFKIEASLSDANSVNVRPGMKVIVKAGDSRSYGRVEMVIPSVENAGIRFTVGPDSSSGQGLRLNQKVEVYLVTSFRQHCLLLQNGPYFTQSGELSLFVVRGNEAYRTKVVLGESNFEHVEIISGLKEGDEVIIDDLKRYSNIEKIKLKR